MLLSTADPVLGSPRLSPRSRIMTPPPDLPVVEKEQESNDLIPISYTGSAALPPPSPPAVEYFPKTESGNGQVGSPVPSRNTKTSVVKPVVTSPISSNRISYGCKTSPSSPGLSHASSGDLSGLSYGSKSLRQSRSMTLPVDSLPPPPLANSAEPAAKVQASVPAAQALGVRPTEPKPQGSTKSIVDIPPDVAGVDTAADSANRLDISDSNSHRSSVKSSTAGEKKCCSCCTIS